MWHYAITRSQHCNDDNNYNVDNVMPWGFHQNLESRAFTTYCKTPYIQDCFVKSSNTHTKSMFRLQVTIYTWKVICTIVINVSIHIYLWIISTPIICLMQKPSIHQWSCWRLFIPPLTIISILIYIICHKS